MLLVKLTVYLVEHLKLKITSYNFMKKINNT